MGTTSCGGGKQRQEAVCRAPERTQRELDGQQAKCHRAQPTSRRADNGTARLPCIPCDV